MVPVFFLLAGPNGAGKSTLYRAAIDSGLLPPEAEFVNADLYEAQALQHVTSAQARSLLARQWADTRREQLLAAIAFPGAAVMAGQAIDVAGIAHQVGRHRQADHLRQVALQ